MGEGRWFLAHSRHDEDTDIDVWCSRICEMLTSCPDWTAKVTAGRDDYETRAKALGGWKSWCRDVPRAEDYTGNPMFHDIIVPVDAEDKTPMVGRATGQLVEGFIAQGKHVFGWCPHREEFRRITAVADTEGDSWKEWSTLLFEDNDNDDKDDT